MISLRLINDREISRGGLSKVLGGNLIVVILVITILGFILLATGGDYENIIVTAGITAVLIVGYQVFVGNTGIISFGHPAFMALGAYASSLATLPVSTKQALLPQLPSFIGEASLSILSALLIGGIVAALAALVVGPIVMRLTGIAAGIMTLALLVIVNEVLRNLEQFTRGTQTFFGVPKASDFVLVYGILLVMVVIAIVYKFSSLGLQARAIRDDQLAAETLGIRAIRARTVAWVLSAFITGVGGALLAHHLTAFSPKSFFIAEVIPIIVITVLGGTGSILGGLASVLVVTAWLELMRPIQSGNLFGMEFPALIGISQFTLGAGLILLLWLRPRGLLGSMELEIARGRRRAGLPGTGGRLASSTGSRHPSLMANLETSTMEKEEGNRNVP